MVIPLMNEVSVIEGGNTSLQCIINSYLPVTIIWTYNYEYITEAEPVYDRGTLELYNVSRNEGGIYQCIVFNGIVNVTVSITLTVNCKYIIIITFKILYSYNCI